MASRLKRFAALAVVFVLIGAFSGPAVASAAESGNARSILMGGGDMFWNYDFTTKTGAGWNTVDWNVTLFFYNNASIGNVKGDSAVRYGYPAFGGSQYAYLNDNAGGYWDSDRGIKTGPADCFKDTRHFRIYADGDDRMYNTSFGYWVFATTHKDFNELCADYYGDTNGTESDVATRFANNGHAVYRNYGYFYNYEPYRIDRVDSDHRWQCDGYATYIRM